MKVHFSCSTTKLSEYKNNYLTIRDTIKKLGHSLTRDWLENAIKVRERGETVDREEIYKKTVESELMADVVVVEGTVPSFSIGHQITLAIDKSKPVLFLLNKKVENENLLKSTFIDGINSPLLSVKNYDLDNIKSILENFFLKYKDGLHVRFNLVLNNELDNYLDWASFTYKDNKSEFIRKLIQERLLQETEYKKYIEEKL